MSFFDSCELEVPCRNCSSTHKKKIGWMKVNTQLSCSCGSVVLIDVAPLKSEFLALEV